MDDWFSNGEGQKDESALRSSGNRFGLTTEDRVKRPSDFRRIREKGASYRTRHFHVRMLKNLLGRTRLGIAVGKRVGIACDRNRIKRRLREYFRLNRGKFPPSTDIVFFPHKGAATLDFSRLSSELDRLFESLYVKVQDTHS